MPASRPDIAGSSNVDTSELPRFNATAGGLGMLAAIFSFRGRLNRIQYFLGSWGLGMALVVLAVILFVGALGGRSPEEPQNMASLGLTALFCIVVLGPIYLWVSFSMQARRFRDIGWEPTVVIPAWIGLD